MRLIDAIWVALSALRANLLRSILTMLGIIIGVGAVVAMIAIGSGAESRILGFIEGLGSNVISISPGSSRFGGVSSGAGSRPSLTLADAQAIDTQIDHISVVAATTTTTAQMIAGPMNWRAQVIGGTPGIFEARDWTIREGRFFSESDQRGATKVAVIGQTIADNLFIGQSPIGQSIRINRVPFRVIGLLEEKGPTTFGSDQDDTLYIPLSTAKQRLIRTGRLSGNRVGGIIIKVTNEDWMGQVEQDTRALLRQRHKLSEDAADDFTIRNLAQILETSAQTTRVLTLFISAVASVSLLVGGIGIMNIMLVSVTERTREIGLRMAVGARSQDILIQFLIEAVSLSILGGIIGIALGALISWTTAEIAGWPSYVPAEAIALAFIFSTAIGLFFGLYPARRASKLDPIEALRHE